MKSPLLQKKGMDAFLEALNDPETATHDPRADKEYNFPFGSKGTEPENVKQGATWGLLNDILHPNQTQPEEKLQPYRTQEEATVCEKCGGGLTRIGDPNGHYEWICTRCKYAPKKAAYTFAPLKAEDLRRIGRGEITVAQWKEANPEAARRFEHDLMAALGQKTASRNFFQAIFGAKCPECGSTEFGLMPADFETAKCENGHTWELGLVKGINAKRKPMHDDSGATTGLRMRPDYGESDSHTSIMNDQNSKSATVKLKWKVDSPATGPYSSFQRRNWPFAWYPNESPAVQLICEDDYSASAVKSGQHAPIKIWVADHSKHPWKWRAAKGESKTLAEAKAKAQQIIDQFPALHPEGANIPPAKQSSFKNALLQKKAITDFDKEQAIEHYRGQDADDIAQTEVFPDAKNTREWAKNHAEGVGGVKNADVEIHETSRHLPPRDDMKRHLDQDVQKEIDLDIDKPKQEGIKVGGGAEPVIKTVHQYPPIPIRDFDWAAYDDNTYDGAPDAGPQCVGYGPTEEAAIADFKEQWAEKHGDAKTAGPLRKAILPVALGLGLGLGHPTPTGAGELNPQEIQQAEQRAEEAQKQKAEKEQMDKLIYAISRAEGARPERNNPGNIADTTTGEIRTFPSFEQGRAALVDQLNRIADGTHSHIKPNMTLEKAGLIYADGDPNWAKNVSQIMRVPKHITMAELIRGPQGKKTSTDKTADDPAWLAQDVRDEEFVDKAQEGRDEAREAFMGDRFMQEEAREAGITLDQLWQEVGNDWANEYFASRYGSKSAS